MLYHVNYFAVIVKLYFCERQTHCLDDQDKVLPVTDTDNELTVCQTPGEKLHWLGISFVSLQAFMKTLKSDISEAYKVQVDCLKDSQSDFYDIIDMKEKVNDLVSLQKAMQDSSNLNYYLGTWQMISNVLFRLF